MADILVEKKVSGGGGFALKNKQKFTAPIYALYTLSLKPEQPIKRMRELFYVDNPTIDVCLCYRRNGSKEMVYSIQVSELSVDLVKEVLHKNNIPFEVNCPT